jgi:hypothetical protein
LSFRSKVKKHTPKVALHSIRSLIVGTYKSGKTRLWKEVTELHYDNPEEALLIAFEKGFETWELENVLPIHQEGDEAQVWEYFRSQVVKGLVQEAKENKVVKLIGIDTADKAIDAATAWIIKQQSNKKGKTYTSLQDISNNTDDNGYVLLVEEMNRQFNALENAGYGLMSLAWTKEKEITLYNGLKYNTVELMMSATGRKVFESQASLICCLFNEIKVTDRDGEELKDNIRDKKDREKASNFHESRVVMLFRPNEYVSIAGGRYTNLPEEPIDYSAKNFMKVYEEAVEGQLKKTKTSVAQLEKQQEEAITEKAQEFAEQKEQKANAQDLIAAIEAETGKLNANEIKEHLVPKFKELLGTPNFRKVEDAELLQKALEFTKEKVAEIKGL